MEDRNGWAKEESGMEGSMGYKSLIGEHKFITMGKMLDRLCCANTYTSPCLSTDNMAID